MPCPTIRNCDLAASRPLKGGRASFGVTFHGTDRFYVACLKDPLLGCRHFNAVNDEVLVMMELMARVYRLSPSDL